MLKFRCAYPTEIEEPTEFFDGEIYIQAWAPASSTETRLVPYNYNTILYDNVKYEE
jgi:cap2 methyltransferase